MKKSFIGPQSGIRFVVIAALAGFGVSAAQGQTALSVGDIQILGVTADNTDSFSFVVYRSLAVNTVLRFTDNGFTNSTGNTASTNEGALSLTFNSVVPAGTVMRVVGTAFSASSAGVTAGVVASGSLAFNTDGDQLFAYQGTLATSDFSGRTLLYGMNFADTDFITSGSPSGASQSYRPTAISSLDAGFDSDNFDNLEYDGTRTGLTAAAYRAAVSSETNYQQDNNRFDLNNSTGFAITTAVGLNWDANGTTANTGGTGTWDTTTQDRFSYTSGASTTYMHWANSVTGSEQTAVFGGTAGTVTVGASGVIASGLTFNTTGYTVGGTNAVALFGTTPTITVTTASHSALVSAPLSGANLIKAGPGKLRLSGANSLTGTTQINAGTLVVENTSGSALGTSTVSVNNAGTLAGNTNAAGRIAGTVTINDGGRITAGTGASTATDSAGLLTTNAQTWDRGGEYVWKLNNAAAAAGTGGTAASWDKIVLTTLSVLGDGTGTKFTITAVKNTANALAGLVAGDSFLIVDGNALNAGTLAAGKTVADLFELDTAQLVAGTEYAESDFRLQFSGGDIAVEYAPVPEPTTAALVALGGSVLLTRRKRRN